MHGNAARVAESEAGAERMNGSTSNQAETELGNQENPRTTRRSSLRGSVDDGGGHPSEKAVDDTEVVPPGKPWTTRRSSLRGSDGRHGGRPSEEGFRDRYECYRG